MFGQPVRVNDAHVGQRDNDHGQLHYHEAHRGHEEHKAHVAVSREHEHRAGDKVVRERIKAGRHEIPQAEDY